MADSEFTIRDDFPPADYEQWRRLVEEDLKGASFKERLVTTTYEGIDLFPVCTMDDWPAYGDPSGFPGTSPFTRGARPLGNVDGGWRVFQESAHPDPATTAEWIAEELAGGSGGVLLRLDRSARAGCDPDTAGPVRSGSGGCGIWSGADLETALARVAPASTPIVLLPGAAFLPAAALLEAWWRSRDVPAESAAGGFGADPLGTLAREGRLPAPLEVMLHHLADLAVWTAAERPGVRAVTVDTTPYHDAGADAVQDLAYAVTTGIAYLRALTDAGLDLGTAARQIRFTLAVGSHFFKAAAKLRAARTLWSLVVGAAGGPEPAGAMHLHVRVASRVLTRRDPWVNLLRNTAGCFAAAVAGAEEVTTEPFDTRLGPSEALGRRLARNTQLILREESGLHRVIDPAGGAWYVERLTDELAERAWALVQRIEAAGGMGTVLESGEVADRIAQGYARREQNLARRRDPVTGVSEFPDLAEEPVVRAAPDPAALLEEAIARTRAARTRAGERAAEPLAAALAGRPERPGALTAAAIESAEAGATIGLMSTALYGTGSPLEISPLPAHRLAEGFEALRDASDAHLARQGRRPRVFLAGLGPPADATPRLAWARNFFAAGGFEAVETSSLTDASTAGEAFRASGARIAVLCSSDRRYASLAVPVAAALKAAGARTVVLAGRGGEGEGKYREAGVDRFIFSGCDVLAILRDLLVEAGVLP
jgi:methylmalonyl-CoA mutase